MGSEDRADDQRDGGHDLDEDIEAGADSVLERVAHGVTDDSGVVLGAALAGTFQRARFDGLLAVVPGAPALPVKMAIMMAQTVEPMITPPTNSGPKMKPQATGTTTASSDGTFISLIAPLEDISMQVL